MKSLTKTSAALVITGMFLLLLMPLASSAADAPLFRATDAAQQNAGNTTQSGGFNGFIGVIKNAINIILPVIISLAVLFFLWGIFLYVRSNDPGKQEEARMYIIWSLVFIAVMVSVWGLVNILTASFNLDKTAPTPPPIPEYAN
jgi:hypothetical protein